jgi:phage shock protein A|tara:strand:+ start:2705 stop:2884 length:180 start_codon:yes stop_codon:yes gene_type:complete
MVTTNQLERLRKDSAELSNYVHKLTRKGKEELAHKVEKKRAFLDDYINELELQSSRISN